MKLESENTKALMLKLQLMLTFIINKGSLWSFDQPIKQLSKIQWFTLSWVLGQHDTVLPIIDHSRYIHNNTPDMQKYRHKEIILRTEINLTWKYLEKGEKLDLIN